MSVSNPPPPPRLSQNLSIAHSDNIVTLNETRPYPPLLPTSSPRTNQTKSSQTVLLSPPNITTTPNKPKPYRPPGLPSNPRRPSLPPRHHHDPNKTKRNHQYPVSEPHQSKQNPTQKRDSTPREYNHRGSTSYRTRPNLRVPAFLACSVTPGAAAATAKLLLSLVLLLCCCRRLWPKTGMFTKPRADIPARQCMTILGKPGDQSRTSPGGYSLHTWICWVIGSLLEQKKTRNTSPSPSGDFATTQRCKGACRVWRRECSKHFALSHPPARARLTFF